jgi:hypothetical protein
VQVGDWQSWKPTNGKDIGELQSNLTLGEVEKLTIALDPGDDEKEDDEYAGWRSIPPSIQHFHFY